MVFKKKKKLEKKATKLATISKARLIQHIKAKTATRKTLKQLKPTDKKYNELMGTVYTEVSRAANRISEARRSLSIAFSSLSKAGLVPSALATKIFRTNSNLVYLQRRLELKKK